MKIALAAILIAVGTLGVQAQVGLGKGRALANCYSQLTDEQKAVIDEMRAEFQAEMTVLRDQMQAATTVAEKIEIRKSMRDLREAHIAAVKAQLTEWGYTINTGAGKKGNGKGHGKGHGKGGGLNG